MKFSIICPVFNKKELTFNFIRDIAKYSVDGEIIIVNNNSIDGTDELLNFYKNHLNNLVCIKNDTNLGFGTANNQGAEIAKSENLIFISNDVLIIGDFITPILEFLDDDKVLGNKLLDFDTGWNKFREIENPIAYLEGSTLAIKKQRFVDIGKWDERFFIDYEDLDLCYRAVSNGMKLVQLNLPLKHLFGQTSRGQMDRQSITLESQRKFCEKWKLTI